MRKAEAFPSQGRNRGLNYKEENEMSWLWQEQGLVSVTTMVTKSLT